MILICKILGKPFYPFRFILSDVTHSHNHTQILASPEMRMHSWSGHNRRGQGPSAVPSSLSLPGSSWWVVAGWVLARSAVPSRSQWFPCCHLFASESSAGFFARYFHFPILGVFPAVASPPFGTRGRRKVCAGWCDPLTVLLSDDRSTSSKSSVLGLS